ncbi:MAG: hypothetical protein AAF702_22200 [Chloroflexota bacterium]
MSLSIKSLGVGFLASALGLLTVILVIYAGIATVGVFYTTVDQLARANAEDVVLTDDSVLTVMGQIITAALGNMVSSIWSMRVGFLAFGLLGIFAAWAHEIGLVVDPKRVWYFSFIMLYMLIAVALITWGLTQQEYISLWMADEPELYRWNDVLRRSYSTDISVALILALTISFPIWLLWRLWFGWLLPKFGGDAEPQLKSSTIASDESHTKEPVSEHRAYAERLRALKSQGNYSDLARDEYPPSTEFTRRTSLAPALSKLTTRGFILPAVLIFVFSFLTYFPVQSMQRQVAVNLQHDTAFMNAGNTPVLSFPVTVEPGDGRVRIVNVKGQGTVGIFLSPSNDVKDAIKKIDEWTFEYRVDEYIYNEFTLTGIEPGDYTLHFIQDVGWGWFEFTLSQGGGTRSIVLAALMGFLVACMTVSGLLLFASSGTAAAIRFMPS